MFVLGAVHTLAFSPTNTPSQGSAVGVAVMREAQGAAPRVLEVQPPASLVFDRPVFVFDRSTSI